MSKQMENEDFDRTIRQNEEDKTIYHKKCIWDKGKRSFCVCENGKV